MVELVEARESLEKKDGEIETLRQNNVEMEQKVVAAVDEATAAATAAATPAEPKVVEVIKEVSDKNQVYIRI